MRFWQATLLAISTAWSHVNAADNNVGANVIDLTTQKWTLTSPNHPDIKVPATIPSQAHVDLYKAGVITDPISGLNDFDLRWVAYSNWTYTANVAGLRKDRTLHSTIVFNGLDTFAAVEFCGKHIANTDNQFRQYSFDISQALWECRQRDPVITVKFGATPNISQAIADLPGQEKWPDETICEIYEFPNRQYVRKEQSDFGWDWGPALMPVGIWQPARIVQLKFLTSLHVKNTGFDLYRKGQLNSLPPSQTANWIFNASIDLVGKAPSGSTMRYTILDAGSGQQVSHGQFNVVKNSGDIITGVVELDQSKYELWWPNGLGDQKLYNMKVDIVWGGNTILSVTRRMGFRTIVLNMEPISQEDLNRGITNGNNWHFEINGHVFYAKGSNFVPPDVFWPRVTRDHLKSILTSVVDGNQNMLRVWSSGAYAPDDFYELADEMGVMLWSEFQFSVSLYPVAPDFLENVRQEAVYNVRRVNHHPSLAVWAGGNEMEKDELPIIRDRYKDQYPRYLAEYYELFLNTLLPAVYGNSRSIGYMPCSTNNGYIKLDHSLPMPWVNRLYDTVPGYLYGDSDHYNYDAGQGFNVDTYLVGRFANEFGFPSMPSLEGWREAIPDSELQLYSKMTLLRNHHYPAGSLATDNYGAPRRGTDEMIKGVKLWYPQPQKTDSIANFSAWCHSTQVYQADFYRNKIQYYRASSGLPQRQLGALYWQLNDIWQAPSWSSMEYSGRWKMMFYATKDIFKPVIIAPVWNVTDGILTMFAVSDQLESVSGEATWEWISYDGSSIKSVPKVTKKFTVGSVNATILAEINIKELKTQADFPVDNAVLVASLKASGTSPITKATKTFEHSNFFTATPLSKAKITDPGLKVTHNGDKFTVTAQTGVSAFTWLAPPPSDAAVIVVFEDNGFLLKRGETRELGYRVVSGSSPGWEGRVTASSIWNNTLPV